MHVSIALAALGLLLAVVAGPASAQSGPPTGQGGKPTTLNTLSCGPGEIARVDSAGAWTCSPAVTELESQDAIVDDMFGLSWKTIFVTSRIYGGDLGGLSGADFICQQHADRAGLRGRFKAWLSTYEPALQSSFMPANRFTRSTVPYEDPLHHTVAADYAQLTSCVEGSSVGCLDTPLVIDEFGNDLSFHPVLIAWTNTKPNGENFSLSLDDTDTCLNWTSNAVEGWVGQLEFRDYRWTNPEQFAECGAGARLICVEQ